MENIVNAARQLGRAIQQSEEYRAYDKARRENDGDKELQAQIGEFNLLRMSLGNEMGKEPDEQDKSKIECLNKEMREAYEKIMANPRMKEFEKAKSGMDEVMNIINDILTLCIEGTDPDKAEPQDHSCDGDCSCCSGGCGH
ncbi:MAG: YlbF family regulator [Acutalibacteraceae bacterium]